jgi:NAD-dependent dihydropyrimidine dehydrogenase PreA subunit
MNICLNTDMCMGCGLCVEACPPQAIHVMASKAVIEPKLCLVCGACIEACTLGAITLVEPTALMRVAQVQVLTRAHVVQNTPRGQRGLALWTRIAATLIEQQVVPRLMDAFIAALERRLAQPRPTPATLVCQGSEGHGRMLRYRRRDDPTR